MSSLNTGETALVVERLRAYLAGVSGPDRLPRAGQARGIPEGADLVEEGYLDSMGLMDLVGFLESEFRISVENDELRHENLATLSDCARFVIGKKLPEGGSGG